MKPDQSTSLAMHVVECSFIFKEIDQTDANCKSFRPPMQAMPVGFVGACCGLRLCCNYIDVELNLIMG